MKTYSINSDEFHETGESFLEPKVAPPLHGDQIPEPLVSQLVGDNRRHSLLINRRRLHRIVQQRRFPTPPQNQLIQLILVN